MPYPVEYALWVWYRVSGLFYFCTYCPCFPLTRPINPWRNNRFFFVIRLYPLSLVRNPQSALAVPLLKSSYFGFVWNPQACVFYLSSLFTYPMSSSSTPVFSCSLTFTHSSLAFVRYPFSRSLISLSTYFFVFVRYPQLLFVLLLYLCLLSRVLSLVARCCLFVLFCLYVLFPFLFSIPFVRTLNLFYFSHYPVRLLSIPCCTLILARVHDFTAVRSWCLCWCLSLADASAHTRYPLVVPMSLPAIPC